MIIPFSLRLPDPPAIAGTQSAGAASQVPCSGLHTRGGSFYNRGAADVRPVTRTARPARRGRRQTPGHRDPNFGFTARGVGGTWI